MGPFILGQYIMVPIYYGPIYMVLYCTPNGMAINGNPILRGMYLFALIFQIYVWI